MVRSRLSAVFEVHSSRLNYTYANDLNVDLNKWNSKSMQGLEISENPRLAGSQDTSDRESNEPQTAEGEATPLALAEQCSLLPPSSCVEIEQEDSVKESGGNSTVHSTGDSGSEASVDGVDKVVEEREEFLQLEELKRRLPPCTPSSSRDDLNADILNETRKLKQGFKTLRNESACFVDFQDTSHHGSNEAQTEEVYIHEEATYLALAEKWSLLPSCRSSWLELHFAPPDYSSVVPQLHKKLARKQEDVLVTVTNSSGSTADSDSDLEACTQLSNDVNIKVSKSEEKIVHFFVNNSEVKLYSPIADSEYIYFFSQPIKNYQVDRGSKHNNSVQNKCRSLAKTQLKFNGFTLNQPALEYSTALIDNMDTTSLQIGCDAVNRSNDISVNRKGEEGSRLPPDGPSNHSAYSSTHSTSSAAAVACGASTEFSATSFHQNCKLFNSADASSLDHTHLFVYSASAAGDCLPFTETFTNNFSEDVTSGRQVKEEKEDSVEVFTNSLADPLSSVPSALYTAPASVLPHSPLLPPSNECCKVIMAASKYSRSLLPIGSRVSCPSRVSSVWSGAGAMRGLTVVYGGEEFTAVQSSAPRPHLETWSSLHHYNIQELSAVLGDCPLHRETTYLLTPKRPSESVRSLKEIMLSTPSIISRLSSSANSKEKDLVLKNVKFVLLEVLSGLSFLHSQGLVYRQLSMQNILLDMSCGCGDVFLCPHEGRGSYRVYLADLSKVVSKEEVELSQHEDVISFRRILEELMFRGTDTAVKFQVVERECPELKGLEKVYLSCVQTSSEVATVQKLVQDLGHLDTTIPPPSPTMNDMQTTTSSSTSTKDAVQTTTASPRSTGGVVPIPPPSPLIGGGVNSAQQETAPENGKESNAKMIVGHFSSLPKDAVVPTGGDKVQAVAKAFYIGQSVLGFSSVAVPPVPAHEGSESSNNRIAVVSGQKMDQKETARGRSTLEGDEYITLLYEEMKDTMEPSPPEGKIIFSTCAEFTEGSMLPLPSAAAMADTIGKGGNGVVSYVYHMGKEFAVKETCLREEELRTLAKLSGQASRNVLPISAVMEGPPLDRYHGRRACYQLMPRATGDVRQMLDRSGSPTLCHYFFKYKPEPAKSSCVLANTRVVLRQALRGLQHLHSKGIVHRDVKLQNILLDMRCGCGDVFLCPHEGRGSYRVYLADFDSALDVERARGKLEERARKGSVLRFTPYGTQGYRAPETSFFYCSNQVLSPEPLSLATRMVLGSALTPYLNPAQDLWSFGCTVLKLFVGATGPISQKEVASVLLADCLRYSTQSSSRYQHSVHGRLTVDDEEMKKLLKVSSVKKYFPLAVELQDLIRQCLQVDPHLRRSAEQCADLPFFKPIDLATDKKSYPSEARQNTPAVELPYPTPRVAGEETYSHQRDGNNINDVKKGNSR